MKAQLTFNPQPTWFSYVSDGHALLLCHETQDGEDGKPRHKAGPAVQASQQQAVPKKIMIKSWSLFYQIYFFYIEKPNISTQIKQERPDIMSFYIYR